MDEPPYILDIPGLADGDPGTSDGRPTDNADRAWIGIQFECCSVYTRIYRNRQATAYEGCCPRCARPVRIRVGPGGTSNRIFRAI